MAEFKEAVKYVLHREGGLNDDPNDSGGITNFGISLRFLRSLPSDSLRMYGIFEAVSEKTIRDLTPAQAELIYKIEFWDPAPFGLLDFQLLANYLFDMAVLHGIGQSIKHLQRATWAATFTRDYIKDDGVMGLKTIGVVNALGHELLPILVAIRASFCRLLAEIRPKDKENLNGWLNRCYQI